jgi:uncharacterized protein (TIGR03067 family)
MRAFMAVIAALSLAFVPAPFAKPERADRTNIQGKWVLIAQTKGGKPVPPGRCSVVISGNQIDFSDETQSSRWEIAINPKENTPTLDLTAPSLLWSEWVVRDPQDPARDRVLLKAVCSLKGDTLKVCYNSFDWWKRPDTLDGKNRRHHLRIFKRQKP